MAKWNPWHGCHKISAGCQNCYVYRIDARHNRDSSIVEKTNDFGLPLKHSRTGEYRLIGDETVYTCFSSDFFLEDADSWRAEAWRMIRARQDLRFKQTGARFEKDGRLYSIPRKDQHSQAQKAEIDLRKTI